MTTAMLTVPDFPPEVLRASTLAYGIHVVPVGEDEVTFVMPGHVRPLRAIAAASVVARDILDFGANMCDDRSATLADALELVRWTWAVLHDPADCAECEPGTEPENLCTACTYMRFENDWWLRWNVADGTPGAFPVTVVETS